MHPVLAFLPPPSSKEAVKKLKGVQQRTARIVLILATAYSNWRENNEENGAKLYCSVANNMTRSNGQELQLGGSGWTVGKTHERSSVALEHVTERDCAISTLGNFQESARQTTADGS